MLFLYLIWISLNKKRKKIRPIKNTRYDWLINHIPKSIRVYVVRFKDKIVSLFKTNTPKQTVYGRGKKLSKPKKQNIKRPFISEGNKEKNKDRIIRDIWTLFDTEEEKKKKEIREKKELDEKLIKDRIIRDIRTLFEQQQEDYYKPKKVNNFWNNNYIEYESNGDKNRNLSLDKYLNKIEPYLNVTNN